MPGNRAKDAQRKRNREAADWILRNNDPRQPAEEKSRFQAWINADPQNCQTYNTAEQLLGDAQTAIQSDTALSNIRIKPRSPIKPVVTALFFLAIAGAAFLSLDGPIRMQADVVAGVDEMPVVTLQDGSTVQLNSSSAIAVDFTAERRVVRLLRGQAYFEVAHASERPFSVDAGPARVTALGTAFDVRYSDTDLQVSVTENTVMIEPEIGNSGSLQIHEGEQALLDRRSGSSVVQRVDSNVALSWRRGQIAVENAPLFKVVEEIGRHFSGRIVIASDIVANRRISGTINVTDTEAALSFLRAALGVKTTRVGPLILIRS